jgi:hypothetical protein
MKFPIRQVQNLKRLEFRLKRATPLNSAAFAVVFIMALSGCAENSRPSVDTQSSELATIESASPAETSFPTSQESKEFIFERYAKIAANSCNKALEVGVVEQNGEATVKLLMVPKDQDYKGFSAAYIEDIGEDQYTELLYEIGYFSSCADYVDISLAAEAGEPFEYVQIDEFLSESVYEITREFDSEQYTMRYEVVNGLITSSVRISNDPVKLTITYGTSQADHALLIDVVDQHLSD